MTPRETREEGESPRGGEHVIRIEEESIDRILSSLERKLNPEVIQHQHKKSATIHRVRFVLRNGNEATYTPKFVSIGPYHHTNKELKDQDVKLNYLSDLIQRSPQNSLRNYVVIAMDHAKDAMKQYCEGVDLDDPEGFVEMMVIDGCFIIEFLVKWYLNDKMGQMNTVRMNLPLLRNDLLLVENQIPFKILEALFKGSAIPPFKKENEDNPYITITELALFYFLDDRVCAQWMAEDFINGRSFHHLLHLYHFSLNPSNQYSYMHFILWLIDTKTLICKIWAWIKKILAFPFILLYWTTLKIHGAYKTIFQLINTSHRSRRHQRWLLGIPNARQLRDTGFKFKKKTGALSFLDVSHQGNTILIPVLSIDDSTLIHFQNLITFEDDTNLRDTNLKDMKRENQNHFNAFVTLMDSLIDTAEDVAILKESGIIENRLGDDKKVADFFNNLHRGSLAKEDHYLGPLFNYVTKYYTSNSYKIRFYRWRKKFVPDYFSNPWAVPSMIAAFILLLLTVAQTFYTIYPYYHPQSNNQS